MSEIKSREFRSEKKKVKLSDTLEYCIGMYRDQVEKRGVRLDMRNKVMGDTICLDEMLLQTILVILIGNAAKFTFQSYIEVTISRDGPPNEELICVIEDTGLGIPQHNIPRLFTLFGQHPLTNQQE